jgi:nucleoside-diphosphate-sugar epimerase
MKTLLTIGYGYSAQALARHLPAQDWRVIATSRSADKAERLRQSGVEARLFSVDGLSTALEQATHLLISAAPGAPGDSVLTALRGQIGSHIEWVGYLSSASVYGDHQGAWVDETVRAAPSTQRGQMRLAAEQAWQDIAGLPLHIFRLAGIYGPGRSALDKLRSGHGRRIVKAGQIFNRIHVEDIAQVLAASIAQPNPGRLYNVADDRPAPPQDVIAYAAKLLALPIPKEEPFESAKLSPMSRSFYTENKCMRNARIKEELGVQLLYPDYRAGLCALLAAEKHVT